MQVHREVSEEPAGNPGKHRTDHERQNFESRSVDAHCFCRDFIVSNGNESAPITRIHEVVDRGDSNQGEQEDPEEKEKHKWRDGKKGDRRFLREQRSKVAKHAPRKTA